MNVAPLRPRAAGESLPTVNEQQGIEQDAEVFSFKLLNKRARLRVSESPVDLAKLPGKGDLLAVAPSRGWFAAVALQGEAEHLICSPLSHLRDSFESSSAEDGEAPFSAKRILPLPLSAGSTSSLVLACNDTRLLLASVHGSILVYDAVTLLSEGASDVPVLHTFPASAAGDILGLFPNPGGVPELVGVLRRFTGAPGAQTTEVLDVNAMTVASAWQSGDSPETVPTSMAWSPKGKQIALGLASGEIVAFVPSEPSTVKSFVPRPPSATNHSVINLIWTSNTTYHAILVPRGPPNPESEQTHFIITTNAKSASVTYTRMNAPYQPFPGLRPPGAFVAVLRDWDPAECLLVVADSTSSDIGVIGCVRDAENVAAAGQWRNLSLDESSTPSLPLDANMEDTVLVGLQVDASSTKPFSHTSASGASSELPPPPLLFAYLSDGTLQAWHVVNGSGTAYAPPAASLAAASSMQAVRSVAMTDETSAPDTAMTQPSMSASSDAALAPATPMDSDAPRPSGFGAFANATPSPFGSSSAFGSTAGTGSSAQANGLAFGGMSLGSSGGNDSSTEPKANSAFGAAAGGSSTFGSSSFGGGGSSAFGANPSSAFGAGTSAFATPTKPSGFGAAAGSSPFGATPSSLSGGFGAFGNTSTASSFSVSPGFGSATPEGKPSASAFGQGGFGQSTSSDKSAFGSSGFGQSSFGASTASTSGFGSSGFGQSSLGKPAFGQPTSPAAGSGFAGFGTPAKSAFGAAPQTPPAETSAPTSGGFASFAAQPSAFSGFKATEPPATPKASASAAPASGGFAGFATPGTPAFGKSPQTPAASWQTPGTSTPGSDGSDDEEADVKKTLDLSPSGSPPATPAPKAPASLFTTSASSSTSGAFGSLQSTPNAFAKLGQGFGAFGGASSASSPFLKPAAAPPDTPKSAFGAGGFGVKPASSPFGSTTPIAPGKSAFGATSAFGASAQSAFGQTSAFGSTTPKSAFEKPKSAFGTTTPASAPSAGGAFSAFSGATSTLSAAASEKASFGDLLRSEAPKEGGDSKLKSAFAPQPAFTTSASKAESKPASPPLPQESQADGPSVESSFGNISQLSSSFEDISRGEGTRTPEGGDEDEQDREDDDAESFLSESFSDHSGRSITPPQGEDEDGPEEEGEQEGEDVVEGESHDDEQDGEGDSEEEAETPPSPSEPQEPPQRPSASASPTPTISRAASPATPPAETKSRASSTPPGTPAPEPPAKPALVQRPSGIPLPKPPGFASLTATGAKPIRSSPLASFAVSGGDAEQEAQSPASATASKPSAFPKAPSLFPPASTPTGTSAFPGTSKPPPAASPFGTLPAPTSSIFGKAPASTAAANGSAKPSPPTTPFAMPSPSLFGSLPATPAAVPAPSVSPFSLGVAPKKEATTPPPSFFSSAPAKPAAAPALAPSPFTLGAAPKAEAASSKPPAPPKEKETGMQAACSELLSSVERELEDMRNLAQGISEQRNARQSSFGFAPPGAQSSELSMDQITRQAVAISTLDKDATAFYASQKALRRSVDDLDRDMLKVITRKEEIARFNKAKTDKSFAKMLKSRTLPPEHLESQIQLRRDIRTIRDTLKKVEVHVESSKKKLAAVEDGKPTLKPSSLEMIARTMNNVDAAIDQDSSELSSLSRRIARLNLGKEKRASSGRSLPATPARSERESTPALSAVAGAAAAALNAERSAQRLKQALLAARKEPLLNTSVLSAPPPPSIDDLLRPGGRRAPAAASPAPTPPLAGSSSAPAPSTLKFEAPSPSASVGFVPPGEDELAASLNLPPPGDDVFAPQDALPAPSHGSRRTAPSSRHLRPVALPAKKATSPTPGAAPSPSPFAAPAPASVSASPSTPKPAAFQWGPLPPIGATPRTSLAFDLRKSASPSPAK